MALLPGTPIGNKYIVRRKLAEGGMAEIYLCSSRGPEGFEKEVAIKRIKPFLLDDPGFVKMFVTEARVASKLSHANVVQIFDFDRDGDSYYLAMEFVRGQSLWSIRRRARERMQPLSPVLVAQIGAEVARGLDHAHRLSDRGRPLGIVHRDVTPHNVLVSYEGVVKLTDFGIAKAGDGTTAPGILKGKFAYMSPEQARGEAVDARTDIFALGVVMWELLTGGRLFEGDGDVAVLKAVQERAIPPPARLNPEVPGALDAAVMKALERDRDRRFESAAELERALTRFLFESGASPEQRDLGSHIRALFPDELLVAEAPHADEAQGPPQGATSVDSLSGEDSGASTYVLPGREQRKGKSSVPPPPAAVSEVEAPPAARAPSRAALWLAGAVLAMALVLTIGRHLGRPAIENAARVKEMKVAPAPTSPASEPIEAGASRAEGPERASPDVTARQGAVDSHSRGNQRRPEINEPTPVEPVGRSILRVKIKPWGTVYLDGRLLGEASPELRAELPAGAHRLTVKHQESWKRDVTVRLRAGAELYREWTVPSVNRR